VRSILIIVSVLIAYGSLYPFDFQMPHDSEIHAVMNTVFNPFATTRGDLLGNIALFVPYGFAGVFATAQRSGLIARLILVLLSGALLAFVLQVGQFFVPQRDPSLVDVFWNVAGIVLGAGFAVTPLARRLLSSIGKAVSLEVPVLLAGIWLAGELMPLVPSLDLQLLKQNLKPLLAPEIHTTDALLNFAAWLTALHFLWSSKLLKNWTYLLPALPFAVMGAQLFIVANSFGFSELVGASVAVVVWVAARNSLRPVWLALLLAIGILASNLYPLDFSVARNVFSWVPFSDFLEGNMVANASSFVRKAFLYGALIWLLKEMGAGWKISTGLTFVALIAQEALQIYVPGATAGVTDPILAVLMATAMYGASRGQPQGAETQSPVAAPAREAPPRGGQRSGQADQTASVWHLSSLDGLRGLAALAVFGVHFNQAAHLHGKAGPFDLDRFLTNGNTGVALFFVLSGFLLSIPFWRAQLETGRSVDTRAYAVRRLARIVPAYYFCLFLLIMAMRFSGGGPTANDVLSHVLFLHNLKDSSILSINPPFWTLAVEMQFYVLLPLLFLGLKRLSAAVALVVVLFLAVGTYVANFEVISYLLARNHWPINVALIWPFAVELSGPDSFVLTYSIFAHLTFFLTGIGTAWLFLRGGGLKSDQKSPSNWINDVIFWVAALAVLMILSTPLDDVLQFPLGHYNWPYVPLLLAAMVLTAPRSQTAKAVLDNGPVRWLGLISYGVYIYHYPTLRATERLMGLGHLDVTAYWPLFGAVAFAGTIVVASLSYLLLEKPIMQAARGARPVQKETAATEEGYFLSPQMTRARVRSKTKGWAEVPIGLRSEHMTYLEQVSIDRQRSLSSAIRHIIGEFIKRLSQEEPGHEVSHRRLVASSSGIGSKRRSHEHQHLVNLPNDYVDFLSELSAKLGTTMSHTVQMILDDFIMESAQKEKIEP